MPEQENPQEQLSIQDWEEEVRNHYQIPKGLWLAIPSQESGGNWDATSPTGVKGKYQVTQDTAKRYGLDRNDPYQQVVAAARTLRDNYDRLSKIGDEKARWLGAVGRYYGGNSAVDKNGNISSKSLDGVSTPVRHVERVAKFWGDYERQNEQRGQGQTDQPVNTPLRATAPPQTNPAQESAPVISVRWDQRPGPQKTTARGPVVQPVASPFAINQGATGFQQQQARAAQNTAQISPEVQARADKIAQFQQQSLPAQAVQKLRNWAAQGGQQAQQTLQNIVNAAGRAGGYYMYGRDPGPVDLRTERGKAAQEATAKNLAQEEATFPNTPANRIAGGIVKAVPSAAAMTIATELGLPAVLVGGGMAAANADWKNHPRQAVVDTAINAIAPLAGGAAVAKATTPILRRLPSSLVGAGTIAAQGLGGAAGNIAAVGAEQAYNGDFDLQKLAEEGVIGIPLGLVGSGERAKAIRARQMADAATGTTPRSIVDQLGRAMERVTDPGTYKLRQAVDKVARPGEGALTGDELRAKYAESPRTSPLMETLRALDPESHYDIEEVLNRGLNKKPGESDLRTVYENAKQKNTIQQILQVMEPDKYANPEEAINRGLRAQVPGEDLRTVYGQKGERAAGENPIQGILDARQSLATQQEQARAAEAQRVALDDQANRPTTELPALSPVQQERNRRLTIARQTVQEYQQAAARHEQAGNYVGVLSATESAREAMADLVKQLRKESSAGAGKLRAQLKGELAVLNARVGDLRKAARESGQVQLAGRGRQTQQAGREGTLLGSVVNPEGGVPVIKELPVDFSHLADKQSAPKQDNRLANVGILSRIRALGGIKPGINRGELANAVEKRYPGLVNKNGLSPDELIQYLHEDGYPVDRHDLNTLWDSIDRAVAGQKITPLDRQPNTRELSGIGESYSEYLNRSQGADVSMPTGELTPEAQNRALQLDSAYQKLGTSDPAEISQLIRNADKRYKKSATPEEAAAAGRAWAKVERLTPEEHAALAAVIPEHVFHPVKPEYAGEGNYGRAVQDFAESESLGAQGEHNFNEVMDFFGEMAKSDKRLGEQEIAEIRSQVAASELARKMTGAEHQEAAVALGLVLEQKTPEQQEWVKLYAKLTTEGLTKDETTAFKAYSREAKIPASFIRALIAEGAGQSADAKGKTVAPRSAEPVRSAESDTGVARERTGGAPATHEQSTQPAARPGYREFVDRNKGLITRLHDLLTSPAATTEAGQRQRQAIEDALYKAAKAQGVETRHVDAVVIDAMNAQMRAARKADAQEKSLAPKVNKPAPADPLRGKLGEIPLDELIGKDEAAKARARDEAFKKRKDENETPLFSRRKGDEYADLFGTSEKPAPTFFSQAERAVETKAPNKASGLQMLALLENPQGGVKAEEMKWLGLPEWLRGKESVTKQEVLDFIKANQVEVKEVTKGVDGEQVWQKAREAAERHLTDNEHFTSREAREFVQEAIEGRLSENQKKMMSSKTRELIDAAMVAHDGREGNGATIYDDYTLPGAKEGSYRELLLTMPEQKTQKPYSQWLKEDMGGKHPDSPQMRELYANQQEPGKNYKSIHWDEPNVLAHVRFNDRTGPNGEKILHIEEIQSDWGQAGRKYGYVPEMQARIRFIDKRLNEIQSHFDKTPSSLEERKSLNEQRELVAERARLEAAVARSGVPDMPFKKSWHEFAFKRMLRYAAEHGYDKMTWTTGKQQAERFDLSKRVDAITYGKVGKKYWVGVEKDGREITRKHSMTLSDIEDFIGQDMARKIERGEGEPHKRIEGIRTLRGDNLRVGGEGMKGFYDQILPAFANKYAKKWGAKVGETEIHVGKPERSNMPPVTEAVHFINITPAMRDSVMEGQPLFSRRIEKRLKEIDKRLWQNLVEMSFLRVDDELTEARKRGNQKAIAMAREDVGEARREDAARIRELRAERRRLLEEETRLEEQAWEHKWRRVAARARALNWLWRRASEDRRRVLLANEYIEKGWERDSEGNWTLPGTRAKISAKEFEAILRDDDAMMLRTEKPEAVRNERGQFAQKRISYWDTPIPSSKPKTKAEAEQFIDHARAEFRQKKTGPGVLWINRQAMAAIASAARQFDRPISMGGFAGVAMHRNQAELIANFLESKGNDYAAGHRLKVVADQIREAVADADAHNRSRIVIADPSGYSLAFNKSTLREERFHVWQIHAGLYSDQPGRALHLILENDPVYKHIQEQLIDEGYPKDNILSLVTEAPAKIASGQWREYGLESEQQGLNFLFRYLHASYRLMGEGVFDEQAPGTARAREIFDDVQEFAGIKKGAGSGSRMGRPGEIRGRTGEALESPANLRQGDAERPESGGGSGREGVLRGAGEKAGRATDRESRGIAGLRGITMDALRGDGDKEAPAQPKERAKPARPAPERPVAAPERGGLRDIRMEVLGEPESNSGPKERTPKATASRGKKAEAPAEVNYFPPDESEGSTRERFFKTVGSGQAVLQLGSPGFVGRNILQHASYAIQSGMADRVAQAVDAVFSGITGKPRTTVVPGDPVSNTLRGLKTYIQGIKSAHARFKAGEALDGETLPEAQNEPTNKVARVVTNILTYINKIPDAGNYAARLERRLRILTATAKRNGIPMNEETMAALTEQAQLEAAHDSMTDPNFVSATMSKLKEGLNTLTSPITGTKKFGLGDFVVKYTQVPGALVRRGIEYSPAGLIEAAFHASRATLGKGGAFESRAAMQSLGRALSGTASTIGMGAALASMGVLVEPEKDDFTSEDLERERGVRGFSINLSAMARMVPALLGGDVSRAGEIQPGDKLVPIDWAQPWAMGASVGAAMFNQYKQGKMSGVGVLGAGAKSFENLLEIMGDQSVLKNLREYSRAAKGKTFGEQATNIAAKFIKDAPQSFTPSLTRQIGNVIDPKMRDYRPEERGGILNALKEGGTRAIAGTLPGLSTRYPDKTSAITAEPRKTAQGEMGIAGRLLNFLSPVTVNEYKTDPLRDEIIRLNTQLNKRDISLYVPPLTAVQTKRPGYQEPTSLLRQRENQFAYMFADKGHQLVNAPGYQALSDDAKADAIRDLVKDLRDATYKKGSVPSVGKIISASRQSAAKAAKVRPGQGARAIAPQYR